MWIYQPHAGHQTNVTVLSHWNCQDANNDMETFINYKSLGFFSNLTNLFLLIYLLSRALVTFPLFPCPDWLVS